MRRLLLALPLLLLAACTSTTPPPVAAKPACGSPGLGVTAVDAVRALRKKHHLPDGTRGALVAAVAPGGPAAQAGLAPGDVIERVGDTAVANRCDLLGALAGLRCGEGVTLSVRRAGALLTPALRAVDEPEPKRSDPEACAAGDGAACANEAYRFATGSDGAPRDDAKAMPLYVRACELGDAAGCYNAGLLRMDGRGIVWRVVSDALSEYEDACRGGEPRACTNLGALYDEGRFEKQDSARAAALFEEGCGGSSCYGKNLRGCVNLGRLYRDGRGVRQDAERAARLFSGVCGHLPATKDPDDEAPRACALLGALHATGNGVAKDPARALELSRIGCDAGDPFGCFNVGVLEEDPAAAARAFRRACNAGDAESCFELGRKYEKGDGVARDAKLARDLFAKACRGGFERGCRR